MGWNRALADLAQVDTRVQTIVSYTPETESSQLKTEYVFKTPQLRVYTFLVYGVR